MTYRMTQKRKTAFVQFIMANAAIVEGRATTRCLTEEDALKWIDTAREADSPLAVRVYAEGGNFVPNSYKYRADISTINLGLFGIPYVKRVGAQRKLGIGPWVTVNNRAA